MMQTLDRLLYRARLRGERGASLVEYALLVALIAVVCIAAVTFLGKSSSGKFGTAGNAILGGVGSSTTIDPHASYPFPGGPTGVCAVGFILSPDLQNCVWVGP